MILAYTCERSILCIYCLCFPPFQILTLLTDFHETSNEHYATGIYSQACLKFPLLINNKVVVTNFYVGLYYTGKTYILYIYIYIYICTTTPQWAKASLFARFQDHTQRRTTVGRTPLDEWSVRRRDLYLTTHNTHNRQTPMPSMGFEPTISVGERPQTNALDRAATGTGIQII